MMVELVLFNIKDVLRLVNLGKIGLVLLLNMERDNIMEP